MVSVNVAVKVYPQVCDGIMANDAPHRETVPASPFRRVISASYALSEQQLVSISRFWGEGLGKRA
jgi:hypothetical protein